MGWELLRVYPAVTTQQKMIKYLRLNNKVNREGMCGLYYSSSGNEIQAGYCDSGDEQFCFLKGEGFFSSWAIIRKATQEEHHSVKLLG
jgi:hypothetical protein